MTLSDKVTFYTARICPYAQRTAIALIEADIPYEAVEIDLQNKPSWYGDVNPDLKVPAFGIQGKSIAESLVLIELVNDLKPEKNLLPTDPIKRAEVRFAIEYHSAKVTSQFYSILRNLTDEGKKDYVDKLTAAYKRLDDLLVAQAPSGPYFLGDQFSLADIAIAPFAIRNLAIQKYWLNGITVPQSARVKEFLEGITSRPSVISTFCGDESLVDSFVTRWGLVDPRK